MDVLGLGVSAQALAVVSGSYSLAAEMHGLHLVVTPLAAEHKAPESSGFSSGYGLVTPRHVESSQGVNLCPLHQQEDS